VPAPRYRGSGIAQLLKQATPKAPRRGLYETIATLYVDTMCAWHIYTPKGHSLLRTVLNNCRRIYQIPIASKTGVERTPFFRMSSPSRTCHDHI